jgi:glucosamine kinase
MSLYLALDVGGTKTAALLADDHRVLARAESGSIKTLRVQPDEAAANLADLLEKLSTQALTPLRGAVTRTCIGTSGFSAPGVRAWMQQAFAVSVGGELLLLGDEVIAIDAAFPGARGVLVIAGTGTNIVGRGSAAPGRSGVMAHTGGWGPALADEGSGHWIGTEALRACFRAIDQAPPSSADIVFADGTSGRVRPQDLPPLLQRAMAALGLSALDDVIGAANTAGFRSAALVPVVVEASRSGDAIALQVLTRAGHDLGALAIAVIRKVQLLEAAQHLPAAQNRVAAGAAAVGVAAITPFLPPEVAFVGGVLGNIVEVREAMHAGLRLAFPGIILQHQAVDPLNGALWHARGCPQTTS